MSDQQARPFVSMIDVLRVDDSLPVNAVVRDYWLKDLQNPLRLAVLPALRVLMTIALHSTYFFKRLIPLQFRAHRFLQWLICFFMKYCVTPEANYLIIRHFGAESNIVNFLIDNSRRRDTAPRATGYPMMIRDLMDHTFVDHDQALFSAMAALGSTEGEAWPIPADRVDFSSVRSLALTYDTSRRKWTQVLDFETAHELFKTTFCFLLTAQEYMSAINGFQLDQSIAMRISRILNDPYILELAPNKFPFVFHGTTGLARRFVLHGLFVEHMHSILEAKQRGQSPCA